MSAQQALKSELAAVGTETFTNPDFKPGTVRHIVLFRYKDGTTEAQRSEIQRRFMVLAKEAVRDGKPYIASIETGPQSSGEGVDGGFEGAFLVTFRSEGDRNYYVGTPVVSDPEFFDPEHQKFKDFVGPYLAEDGVLVFDFMASSARR
ncbi:Dabb family protein [Chelativorans sp. AA-79]|uniref:Dabb family protein n=1 Tax=Chelativorans sp. AA-79 TaxID=3028735 RepID=UPI0023F62076|nr:Dabb family protein [Chelativorans sp. AA-79]WEX08808.1 Dabb family protein [Chelativorans sp. AA-79]